LRKNRVTVCNCLSSAHDFYLFQISAVECTAIQTDALLFFSVLQREELSVKLKRFVLKRRTVEATMTSTLKSETSINQTSLYTPI